MDDKAYRKRAFAAARDKLALAKAKLEKMRTATDLDELAQHWEEFLAEQHRVFLRLKKATERGAGKGWFDLVTHEQRNDGLLRYLLHARDAAEHGIEQVTEKRPHQTRLKFKPGSDGFVKYLGIRQTPEGMEITADPETRNKLVVEFEPGGVHLVVVTDRGTAYDPPIEHLGKPLLDVGPILAAELAVEYLEAKLAEAEAKFL